MPTPRRRALRLTTAAALAALTLALAAPPVAAAAGSTGRAAARAAARPGEFGGILAAVLAWLGGWLPGGEAAPAATRLRSVTGEEGLGIDPNGLRVTTRRRPREARWSVGPRA